MKATRTCSVEGCDERYRCSGFCNTHYRRWRRYGDTELPNSSLTERDRFWSKVAKAGPDECWMWTAARRGPYGLFNVPPTTIGAHRYAFEDAFGPIPTGFVIDHRCRVKLCVNPAHLQLATTLLNSQNHSGPTRRNTSGVRGVWWCTTTQKWRGQVRLKGRVYGIGGHDTLESAKAAITALRLALHPNNLIEREG